MRQYCRICLILLIVLTCTVFGCSSRTALPPLSPTARVLAFGDSLTYGTGAGAGESYPDVLAGLISRTVVNAGVPGEISAEGVARLPALLEREQPDLIIICHGGNDFLRRLPPSETSLNLREMVRQARNRGISVVLVAVPEPGLLISPPSLYREIAAAEGLPLEKSILTSILKNPALKSDQIHPNAAGYRRLAEVLHALLRENGALS
jgi:lysophospholipase L1-like esterase